MLPITNRERETIVIHKQNGVKNEDIAKWMRVSVSSITRIWHLHNAVGSSEHKPQNGGRPAMVTPEQMTKILARVDEFPDITIMKLIEEFALGISESALCRRLIAVDYTLKKRRSIQTNKPDPMS